MDGMSWPTESAPRPSMIARPAAHACEVGADRFAAAQLRMKQYTLAILIALAPAVSAARDFEPFPGRVSKWQGFARHDFEVDSRKCIVVVPKKSAPGRPWIWRARFFGHEPQTDIALLERGYHVAYCDVAGLFGAPRAVEHWNAFYALVTEKHGLAYKVALEGMSRGGLIVYNWAAANPDKVACIYADAPVCDIRSWPGGEKTRRKHPRVWTQCLRAYGLTKAQAAEFRGNPVDRLEPLARAGVPLLHVIGDADKTVPPAENSAVIEKRYRELGGPITVIAKKGVDHHPHSLSNPRPIVRFIIERCRGAGADRSEPDGLGGFAGNVVLRGSLTNSRHAIEVEKKAHVAFMGGSITEMNGYRPMVTAFLQGRYPDTSFTFTDAGIASTCSTTGAFRLASDVLDVEAGPPDLFLVEFAVNDDQDAGHARRECIRGLEGIVRQLRRRNPHADIVIVHFVNPGMLDTLQHGETPLTIASHEAVAEHYGIPSVNLAREIAEQILGGRMTWKDFGGTHPAPRGNAICAGMVAALFEHAWKGPVATRKKHASPRPLDKGSYAHGSFVHPDRAKADRDWWFGVPDWSKLPGSKRQRFREIDMLSTAKPGASLTLEFEGTAIGAYVVAGPDAGVLEGYIDNKRFKPVDLYHRYSRGLHYPRTVLFAADLAPGSHRLKLRVSKKTSSKGHAVRLIRFAIDAQPRQ